MEQNKKPSFESNKSNNEYLISINQKDTVKLLIIGDQAVGKSSITLRYTDDVFNSYISGTTGIDLKKKNVVIKNKETNTDIEYKLLIYDTAGHDRYRQFAKSQIKTVHGIIIVYDVTDKNSFNNVSNWIKQIQDLSSGSTPFVLVGNKTDLIDQRVIIKTEGDNMANKYNINYYETSAYNGNGIDDLFNYIANKAIIVYESRKVMIGSKDSSFKNKHKKSKSLCVCN